MKKSELIREVANKTGLSQAAAKEAIEATFETIAGVIVKEGGFTVTGFGAFKLKETKARVGRNPATGGEVQIPAGHRVGFKHHFEIAK